MSKESLAPLCCTTTMVPGGAPSADWRHNPRPGHGSGQPLSTNVYYDGSLAPEFISMLSRGRDWRHSGRCRATIDSLDMSPASVRSSNLGQLNLFNKIASKEIVKNRHKK